MKSKAPSVGIFDSGVGGFSVAREVRKVTDANIVYYGDCARAPYGNCEESEIVSFIKDDIIFLQDMEVTHFVNACNSMSVLTTDSLLKECNIQPDQYIDMIRAFSLHVIFSAHDKVLVIATAATIRSGVYQEELIRKGVTVFEYAYKDLAQAIERNATRDELLIMIEVSIVYAQEVRATHVLYGCTHYPLVHELFLAAQEKVGWRGDFIDPAIYVAEEVKKWGLEGKRKFYPYSSKDTPAFINNIIKFL
jgi:glutamate racemase